jgi:hypothetical protein
MHPSANLSENKGCAARISANIVALGLAMIASPYLERFRAWYQV